ncbi:MAG: acyltransferase [Proteobacteria bacterium]|nr:acyltransferase [Pseudomonadota bacterium]
MADKADTALFKQVYPELDLLRSTAILLVMLVHFARRVYVLPEESWLGHFASWGWNGVGLFFVLSGFLIGGQIIEQTRRNTFSFKRFYTRRFFRIFPPYYFSLLVVAALFFLGLADTNVVGKSTDTGKLLTDLVYHLFYLQNYISLHRLQSGLYWSLAIEEQFYILIPFVLFFLLRYKRGWLVKGLVALILVAFLLRIAHYTGLLPYIPDTKSWNLGIRFPLHTRFDSLISGVLTAWLFIRYNDCLRRISASKRALLFLFPVLTLAASILYGNDSNSYFNTCWQFTVVNFGFSALILLLITSPFGSYLKGFFRECIGRIARLSYTMYLYHLILLFPVAKLLKWLHLTESVSSVKFLIAFGVYFLCVSFVSSLVYRLIDAPFMRYRAKISS